MPSPSRKMSEAKGNATQGLGFFCNHRPGNPNLFLDRHPGPDPKILQSPATFQSSQLISGLGLGLGFEAWGLCVWRCFFKRGSNLKLLPQGRCGEKKEQYGDTSMGSGRRHWLRRGFRGQGVGQSSPSSFCLLLSPARFSSIVERLCRLNRDPIPSITPKHDSHPCPVRTSRSVTEQEPRDDLRKAAA